MSKPRVLVTNRPLDEHLAPLFEMAEVIKCPDTHGRCMSREEVLALAPNLDAIINQAELRVDAALLDAFPRLRIIANVAIGTDNLDLPLMASRGVWATNTPDTYTESTADLTLGLMLAVSRRMIVGDRYARSGKWEVDGFRPSNWEGTLLHGKTLGIVGYGKIGKAVSRRAEAFGMQVIHHNRTRSSDAGWRTLEALLAESDYLSLHCPLTPQTNKLIDAGALSRMKRGAVLINMSRGKVVDESAMVAALKDGRLRAAGLDVFENEPRIHPELVTMENVVLLPHVGGSTVESRRASRLLCAKNVALVLKGERPVTAVNEVR